MNAIIFTCLYLSLQKSDAEQWYFYVLFCIIGLWYGPVFWATLDKLWMKFNRKLDDWADV